MKSAQEMNNKYIIYYHYSMRNSTKRSFLGTTWVVGVLMNNKWGNSKLNRTKYN